MRPDPGEKSRGLTSRNHPYPLQLDVPTVPSPYHQEVRPVGAVGYQQCDVFRLMVIIHNKGTFSSSFHERKNEAKKSADLADI
ncbi:hypothetical protein CSIM01_11936 [Colletotrichum simmondsii]|uniref:Uncharacterized protein n=1 Tax=Colletotrichum simmondsii TaxID=703756 RepID=A0A135T5K2_9PEZI|nr:hypothetical protein CSIM01_11936 [Colletotrichum simmondsii]